MATVWSFIQSYEDEVYESFDYDTIERGLRNEPTILRAYYQHEIGAKGNFHWQMHFVLSDKIDGKLADWVRTVFDINPKAMGQCVYMRRSQYPASSINYCQKSLTRVQGPFQYIRGAPIQSKGADSPITTILNVTPFKRT